MGSDKLSMSDVSETRELLRTLSNPVRLEIIKFFEEMAENKSVSLMELCNYLTGRLPGEDEEGLQMSLSQNHLPTLESRGWLSYEEETTVITYYGHDEAAKYFRELLHLFTEQEN